MKKSMVYDGLVSGGKRVRWFYFDEEKNEIKGDALFFKKTKDTTRFPVGMIDKRNGRALARYDYKRGSSISKILSWKR